MEQYQQETFGTHRQSAPCRIVTSLGQSFSSFLDGINNLRKIITTLKRWLKVLSSTWALTYAIDSLICIHSQKHSHRNTFSVTVRLTCYQMQPKKYNCLSQKTLFRYFRTFFNWDYLSLQSTYIMEIMLILSLPPHKCLFLINSCCRCTV